MRSKPFLFLSLVLANATTAYYFFSHGESIVQVLWVYWLQSVIIGIINVFRILLTPLKAPSALNSLPIQSVMNSGSTPTIKAVAAGFFMVHYGLFHLIYAVFLAAMSQGTFHITIGNQPEVLHLGHVQAEVVLLNGLIFAVHHVFSFISERQYLNKNPQAIPGVDKLFIGPYSRILPMHLIIIFGPILAVVTGVNAMFGLFILLKTGADLELWRRSTSHPVTIA